MLFRYLNTLKSLPCTKNINGTDYVFGEDGCCEVNNQSDAKLFLQYPDLFEWVNEEKLDIDIDEPETALSVRKRGRPRLTE
jgi:hypothetical protein